LIFEFFGFFSDEEIGQRYKNNQFIPCSCSNWQLNEESYQVAVKAVNLNKNERYMTFDEFFIEWKRAISSMICLY
jgi:serine/threonine-protein kinase